MGWTGGGKRLHLLANADAFVSIGPAPVFTVKWAKGTIQFKISLSVST